MPLLSGFHKLRPVLNFEEVGLDFAAAALYTLMGVLQSLSLFTGDRALRNVNLWGSLFLVSLSVSVFLLAKAAQVQLGFVARKLAGVMSVAVAVWALWVLAAHELAIDDCLDGGGSFNYVHGVCDASANHPALSLAVTHGFVLTLGGLACVASVLFLGSAYPANPLSGRPAPCFGRRRSMLLSNVCRHTHQVLHHRFRIAKP